MSRPGQARVARRRRGETCSEHSRTTGEELALDRRLALLRAALQAAFERDDTARVLRAVRQAVLGHHGARESSGIRGGRGAGAA